MAVNRGLPKSTSMDPLSLGIGAAVSLGSSSMGLFGRKKQRKHEEEMARQQRDWNYRMWKEQNAYNSPEAQMQRLKDAGLNPHLLYGQGVAGATGQADSVPSYQQADSINTLEGFDPFGKFMQFANLQGQNALRAAQAHQAEQNTKNLATKNQIDLISLETNSSLKSAYISSKLAQLESDKAEAAVRRMIAEYKTANPQEQKDMISNQAKLIAQELTNAGLMGELRSQQQQYSPKAMAETIQGWLSSLGADSTLAKALGIAIGMYIMPKMKY